MNARDVCLYFYADSVALLRQDDQLSQQAWPLLLRDRLESEGSVRLLSEGASCGLPTLAESAQQHALLLNTLLEYWNPHMPDTVERLPIT
jgi:hypothetical protein